MSQNQVRPTSIDILPSVFRMKSHFNAYRRSRVDTINVHPPIGRNVLGRNVRLFREMAMGDAGSGLEPAIIIGGLQVLT